MATANPTKASSILLASAPGNVGGGTTQRFPLDVSAALGGVISINTSNDAALTAQGLARMWVSHAAGGLPAANDASWRLVCTLFGTGTASGAKGDGLYYIPLGTRYVMPEITGQTGGSLSASIEATLVTGISST